MGAEVTVLEREKRLLARVTAPEVSEFYFHLHQENGVGLYTDKEVHRIKSKGDKEEVHCKDGTQYAADLVIVGVGVRVNQELAQAAGLEIENGIRVNSQAQTLDEDIYAIGDCTNYFHPRYERYLRLESVQNAVEQAKVAAAAICGKEVSYNALPWFWSDQYTTKLQMVGLSTDHDELLVRKEENRAKGFSVWYFRKGSLLAVDAVNNARAYMMGMKFLQTGKALDRSKLIDPSVELRPANF